VSADDRDDLLFLYAAGALEGDERNDVEAWVAQGGSQVAAQLAQAEAEVAQLGLSLAPVAPSPEARERLLRRIRGAGSTAETATRRAAPWPRLALAAGLAGLLAAGVAGSMAWRAGERVGSARVAALQAELATLGQELAALRGELEAVEAERDEIDAELAEQESAARSLESELVLARKALGVVAAEHAEMLALRGMGERLDAHARVYWDWDEWYCFLRAEGLPPAPGRLYALWLFTDRGEVVGVGVFESDAQGAATLVAPVPHDIGHVVRAGVSLEPDADLGPRPRGEVVLQGG
jgi:anti-sigma-K factor RskA